MALGLQWWIFSIQYFKSAISCSYTKSWWTSERIDKLQIVVVIVYLTIIFITTFWLLVSFPGYIVNGSPQSYNEWYATTQLYCYLVINDCWLLINVVSTIITITSLRTIFKTISQLKSNNVNRWLMVLHGSLMISTGAIIAAAQYFFYHPNSEAIIIYFESFTIVDFLTQITVCYICFTMGSDKQLRDYDCEIVLSASGEFVLQLKPKNESSVSQQQTSTTTEYSRELSEVSINSGSTSNNDLERVKHNESIMLARQCDLIVMQFMQSDNETATFLED